jgi:tripartite-type tricarboxylate transporter receptor subunit TctC
MARSARSFDASILGACALLGNLVRASVRRASCGRVPFPACPSVRGRAGRSGFPRETPQRHAAGIHRDPREGPVKRLLLALAMLLLVPQAGAQSAASFPSKTIRIIVPFNAGSGSDSYSRFYAELLTKMFGWSVTVENRPGGSGVVAINAVKGVPADGHTVLLASVSPMAVNPIVMKNLPYDPFRDFRPVHGLSVGPAAFVVRGDSPHRTVGELIAAMKKAGRPMSVGNYSKGYELIGAWLGTAGGVPVTPVTYKGGSQMVTDVIGGQLDVAANDFSGVAPLIREGRLRALAITGDRRDPMFPDVPTMKESGFPEFETYVWASLYVRADTPDDITAKLAGAIGKAMVSEEGKAFSAKNPGQPLALAMKELGDFQMHEYTRLKKAADAAGIKPE